jgi:general stress protein 26
MAVAQDDIARVWDILDNHSIGMLTTRFARGLRARPLDARPDRSAGRIYFLTDVNGHKDDEIAANPDVCFIVTVPSDRVYLSITARAAVSRDPAKAADIWKKADEVWWKGGAADPNLRVMRLEPKTAELWDGPSNALVAAYEFTRARLTGEKPLLGENIKKTIPLHH